MTGPERPPHVAVIGGGPAGLMAAGLLAEAGAAVTVIDRMPTVGRKFLMAGRGGLNLTHSEPFDDFVRRYGPARNALKPALRAVSPEMIAAWSAGLGEPVFKGSSGRLFPRSFKASPLLRAWLARLAAAGVVFRTRTLWRGNDEDGRLLLEKADGTSETLDADATLLAPGGASWPRLGSDGSWVKLLAERGIEVTPLVPSNCGVTVDWTPGFVERFAGQPLKTTGFSASGVALARGEAMVTATGLEGQAIYGLSRALRRALAEQPVPTLRLDLRPDRTVRELATRLAKSASGQSMANRLRKAGGLSPVAAAILREATGNDLPAEPGALAALIKDVPLRISGLAGMEKAISTAGGVPFEALDERWMLKEWPGVFMAGEALDWDAPTGGYLLQACLATGAAAARGIGAWLTSRGMTLDVPHGVGRQAEEPAPEA